ncbi:MAG TPA: SWIM zinc finger family protein [Dehalococcoidia bacterium]|nr:SWIM zinc finger family protein [Dehalococcoidia bacterium]
MTTASPRRQSSASKVARLHQHPDSGEVHALSSNGVSRYVVTLGDSPACTCPGFTHYSRCYHLATALSRFPAFYTRPAAVIVPASGASVPEPPTPAAPAVHLFHIGGRARRAA